MKSSNQEKFDALPQRQKKYAKTKIALLSALLDALKVKPFASIMIKTLCNRAEVSEPTFFNYFDSKHHMLLYFIQMWSIEMNALAKECETANSSYIQIIKNIFVKSAQQISAHPSIMLEVIAFQAQATQLSPHTISNAEKWLYFESVEGVEALEGMGLESILPPLIHKAVKAGELNKKCDQKLLFLTLSSLFMGTSLLILKNNPKQLAEMFAAELDFIFTKGPR